MITLVNKVLFCATVDYHFKAFHLPYMKWFKEQGWEIHVAASGEIELPYVDVKYNIPIQRSPLHKQNLAAYKKLKEIIDHNHYKVIDCHTPMGGMLARLAARDARKTGTKVIYTAHGFHFCKGAPLMNWILYYPIEKMMAHYTDCLITINNEDYAIGLKRFKAKQIEHVHGVGINPGQFMPISESEKEARKKSFGYQPDDFLLFYAAEFNKNKNQQMLLHSLALIKEEVPHAKLLLAGEGPLLETCKHLASTLGISNMVNFLGFRNDIHEIVPMCDVAVASSLREGLPVNLMEAMACGLPVIATNNRGHKELIQNDKNGWLIESKDALAYSNKMKYLAQNIEIKKILGGNGRKIIQKKFTIDQTLAEKRKIYQFYMDEKEGVNWAIQ